MNTTSNNHTVSYDLDLAKLNMIKQQLYTNDITDADLLDVFAKVPRENFVASRLRQVAYSDTFLPILDDHKEVMLTPALEAKMLQALQLKPDDKVLEVGTGSGYFTALLAKLAQHVYSVEIMAEFVALAEKRLHDLGIENVSLLQGNAANGWEKQQPYDVICLTGSVPILTSAFHRQLKIGGRLLAVIGQAPAMQVTLVTRMNESQWQSKRLFETKIPPLVNVQCNGKFSF